MDPNFGPALVMTLVAGLSTGIGSLIAVVAKRTNRALLCIGLGLSAGVMIYISFMELLSQSQQALTATLGSRGSLYAVGAFFGGILLTMLIDLVIPEQENPHEIHGVEEMKGAKEASLEGLKRVSLMSGLAIAIHNVPEGMVTFLTALSSPDVALPIMLAIMIHNIPEGISVAVLIYYATGSKSRAFGLGLASGLAEPLGALIGYLFLRPFISPELLQITNAVIAGVMVYISFDELLPAAERYGKHHQAILGVIGGMAVMALTLLVL
jgi:ZIP family zinc transporter